MKQTIPLKFNYDDDDLGYYHFDTGEITINPKLIKQCCSEYNTDFYTLLIHVINHEYLHWILLIEHNYTTCVDLDNLVHNKQTDKKNWDYWLS